MRPTPNPTDNPTGSPSSSPSDPQRCEDFPRDEYLALRLGEITDLAILLNTSTPQGQAYELMVVDPSIDPCNSPTLEQRYSLTTLYYATQGGRWINSTGWLVDFNECEWFQVSCDENNQVVSLELGKL